MSTTLTECPEVTVRRFSRYESSTIDLATVEKHISTISSIRGRRSLTTEERIDVMRVFLAVHRDNLLNGRTVHIYKKTAQLIGRSSSTVRDVAKNWMKVSAAQNINEKALKSSLQGRGRPGNNIRKETRIPDNIETHVLIRDFVRGRRMSQQRVTARTILDFLLEQGTIDVPEDDTGLMTKQGLISGLGCVQNTFGDAHTSKEKRQGFLYQTTIFRGATGI